MDRRRTSAGFLILVVLAASFPAPPADAQSPGQGDRALPQVEGDIRDQGAGTPVPAAWIRLIPGDGSGPGHETVSDRNGRFHIGDVHPGTWGIEVRALGYRPFLRTVHVRDEPAPELEIFLVPDAIPLDPLMVQGTAVPSLRRAGFYDRRARGAGTHLTRDQLLDRASLSVSDVFRTIPGVSVVPVPGAGHSSRVLFRGRCAPAVFLDGFEVLPDLALDDYLTLPQIEALEVYPGAAVPADFSNSGGCGVIAIWTRDPRPEPRPFSWRRLAIVAGFVVGSLSIAR